MKYRGILNSLCLHFSESQDKVGTLKVTPKLHGKVSTCTLVLFLSFSEIKYDSTHQSQRNAVDLKDTGEIGERGDGDISLP